MVLNCSIGQGNQLPCGSPGPQHFLWSAITLYLQQGTGLILLSWNLTEQFWAKVTFPPGHDFCKLPFRCPPKIPCTPFRGSEWDEERSSTYLYWHVNWIPILHYHFLFDYFWSVLALASTYTSQYQGKTSSMEAVFFLLFGWFSEACIVSSFPTSYPLVN